MRFTKDDDFTFDTVVNLKLERSGDGISLTAINNHGESKVLMNFKNGKFKRIGCANMQGINTDEEAKIMELI